MTDSRPFASSSDGTRLLCMQCGNTCAAETMACSSCGAELGGETVFDNVHAVETVVLGPRGAAVAPPIVPAKPPATQEEEGRDDGFSKDDENVKTTMMVDSNRAAIEAIAKAAEEAAAKERASGKGATISQSDTTPNGEALPSDTRIEAIAPRAPEHVPSGALTRPQVAIAKPLPLGKLPGFAERTDEEIEHVTAEVRRKPSAADPAPADWGSSEPSTRFRRGFDQHIELPSGCVVDEYEIDAKLGAGAMGVVYSARHVKLGRRVAIKVIAPAMGADPQALARFEREARALASLHHPNIVDVYSFGTLPDDRSYFVMEYLVGETLEERLERGRLPLDEALDVIGEMARALEAAHAQGIVHRDLKPSNTFLVRLPREQRSVVKLLDFGLAKLAVADGVEKTASGAVIGTALYLSPEQARGPNVDGRTDVYALGCIAYELVLGRHPFPEVRTPTAAIAAHLTEPAPHPRAIWPGIPAALDLLLYSMVAKDPSYRPTLAQVRNVIASVRSETVAGRKSAAHRRSRSYGRAWIVALAVFSVFIGIVIGTSLLGGKASRANEPQTSPVGSDGAGPVKPKSPIAVTITPIVPDAGATDASLSSTERKSSPAVANPQVTPSEKPMRRRMPVPQSPYSDAGVLALDSKPGTDVLVDGERKGRTPILGLKLPVGRHKITLINGTYSINESFRVEIKQGQVEKIVKDYSDRVSEAPH